jgi:exodeoxyribonuclease VII large subunit
MLRPETAQRPLTVTELALQVRRQLRPLAAVLVKGEVSGMKQSARGHYGFSIKDADSLIEAFIFAGDARRLPLLPEDGQEFVFRGRVDFWAQGGRLRLIVDYVEFDDVGRLRGQLELLKRRLEEEGAFEPSRKRRLPFLPLRVALITSPTGAVIHDLQETIWDRFPNMGIVVYPAQVQGTASPGSVAGALRRCNLDGLADVVVIARGGGSFEELYAFNTEPVARAILASRIPVVTALGHTSDRTIADMVADAECRTPTDAGVRVVPRKADLQAQLQERGRRLDREVRLRLRAEAELLAAREQRLRQALPALLRQRLERLARSRAELERLSPARQLARREEHLREQARRLEAAATRFLRARSGQLASRQAPERLRRGIERRLRECGQALGQRGARLAALGPEQVLARGYSITRDAKTGAVLRSAADSAPGRKVSVRLAAGALGATVESVER